MLLICKLSIHGNIEYAFFCLCPLSSNIVIIPLSKFLCLTVVHSPSCKFLLCDNTTMCYLFPFDEHLSSFQYEEFYKKYCYRHPSIYISINICTYSVEYISRGGILGAREYLYLSFDIIDTAKPCPECLYQYTLPMAANESSDCCISSPTLFFLH